MGRIWRVRGASLGGGNLPLLVGIVNATPDSFFDGGKHATADEAYAHGMKLVEEGADLLDVGGESTRLGSEPVDPSEERRRVEPVIRSLARRGARVCIDTRTTSVAEAALDAGACAVNDVSGLADPAMLELCRAHGAGACAMHMRANPSLPQVRQVAWIPACAMHMRANPSLSEVESSQEDLEREIERLFEDISRRWVRSGLDPQGLALDPGVGFGKTAEENQRLVGATARFRRRFPAYPWYLGLSRKSWIRPLAPEGSDRLAGSLGGALAAFQAGCDILRVHDVARTREAILAFQACREDA
ncbi:MAG TPA: dihydropteroate synthase [Fibrobacteria bacterium]|nr:dihydropteroate synthase [Fibrobacteria bacterium]